VLYVKQSYNGPVVGRNITSSQEGTVCPNVILVCQAITNGPVAGRIVENQCRAENEKSLAREYCNLDIIHKIDSEQDFMISSFL
jgi:hypothetical protein